MKIARKIVVIGATSGIAEHCCRLWVVEGSISYDGGPRQPAVNILEFRGDKVVRETIYVTEPWDAPEWRARWRVAP